MGGGRPRGGVGPQKSQQLSLPPRPKRRGESHGEGRAPARPAPGSSRASPGAKRSGLQTARRGDSAEETPTAPAAPGAGDPGEGTCRWRRRAGCGPRGPAAAPAPPPPPLATLLPASQSAAAARRLPGAQLPRLASSCARTRRGWGLRRVETAGWGGGQSSHVGCCWRWRDPLGSQRSRSGLAGSIPVRDEDIPFGALTARLCVARNG